MRARFPLLRDRRAEVGLAGMPARGPDLRRSPLRHLPAEGGKGREGGEGFHGRTPAHDASGHVRDQRRRARHREPVAPLARAGVRGNAASQRQDAPFLPHHSRPRLLVRSPVRHGRPALCVSRSQEAPPEIFDHDLFQGAEFSGRGRQGRQAQGRRQEPGLGRGNPEALLRPRRDDRQGSGEAGRSPEQGSH